jgi:hypothetical protein
MPPNSPYSTPHQTENHSLVLLPTQACKLHHARMTLISGCRIGVLAIVPEPRAHDCFRVTRPDERACASATERYFAYPR